MANEWIDIDDDTPLKPGDRIRLNYSTVGLTIATAAQIALVENKLAGEPRFEVIRHSYPEGEGWEQTFWFEIRIIEPSAQPADSEIIQEAGIITVGIVSAVVLGALGFFVWVSFDGATKFVQATGKAGEGVEKLGWTSIQIAAALIAVFLIYKYA